MKGKGTDKSPSPRRKGKEETKSPEREQPQEPKHKELADILKIGLSQSKSTYIQTHKDAGRSVAQFTKKLASTPCENQCPNKGTAEYVVTDRDMKLLCGACSKAQKRDRGILKLAQFCSVAGTQLVDAAQSRAGAQAQKLHSLFNSLSGLELATAELLPKVLDIELRWRQEVERRKSQLRSRATGLEGQLLRGTLNHLWQCCVKQTNFDWNGLKEEQELMLRRINNSLEEAINGFRAKVFQIVKELGKNWSKFSGERKASLELQKLVKMQESQHANDRQRKVEEQTSQRTLEYSNRGLDEHKLCELVRQASKLSNVTVVDLGLNRLSWKVAAQIKAAQFPQLRILNLSAWSKQKSIGEKGAQLLAELNWPNLQVLVLVGNKVGDGGASCLVQARWHALTEVDLSFNKIGDVGMQTIIAESRWPRLRSLVLSSGLTRRQHIHSSRLAQFASRTLALAKAAQSLEQPTDWGCRLPLSCQVARAQSAQPRNLPTQSPRFSGAEQLCLASA